LLRKVALTGVEQDVQLLPPVRHLSNFFGWFYLISLFPFRLSSPLASNYTAFCHPPQCPLWKLKSASFRSTKADTVPSQARLWRSLHTTSRGETVCVGKIRTGIFPTQRATRRACEGTLRWLSKVSGRQVRAEIRKGKREAGRQAGNKKKNLSIEKNSTFKNSITLWGRQRLTNGEQNKDTQKWNFDNFWANWPRHGVQHRRQHHHLERITSRTFKPYQAMDRYTYQVRNSEGRSWKHSMVLAERQNKGQICRFEHDVYGKIAEKIKKRHLLPVPTAGRRCPKTKRNRAKKN